MANKYDTSVAEKQVKKYFKNLPLEIVQGGLGLIIRGKNVPFRLKNGKDMNVNVYITYSKEGKLDACLTEQAYTLKTVSPQALNACNRNVGVWKVTRAKAEAPEFDYSIFSISAKNVINSLKQSFEALLGSNGVCDLYAQLSKRG